MPDPHQGQHRHRTPAGSGGLPWRDFDAYPYVRRIFDAQTWTCWHVVLAFYRQELGLELPAYGVEHYPAMDIPSAIAGAKATPAWQPAEPPGFGDVATFRHAIGCDVHVGVVVQPLHMLHVTRNGGTAIVRYDGAFWRPRLTGFWRWTP